MKEGDILNLDIPLNYQPNIKPLSFVNLPRTIQQRFMEVWIQGEYPVDRFEARILPVSSPIKFNQFVHIGKLNQIHYVAQPGTRTYNPDMLESLNIRSELGFFNIQSERIHEVLERIKIKKVGKVEIRVIGIHWDDFQYIMQQPHIRSIKLIGSIIDDFNFKDFLQLLSKCTSIYIELTMDLPLNYESVLENWASSKAVPEFFFMMFKQKHPLPVIHLDHDTLFLQKKTNSDSSNTKTSRSSISSTKTTQQ
uniref:Uncharacterized protein n=1 Tax=Panagrolaimus sp. JU765 TaxID=591449 RepID=A0AC34QVT3_9BILA